jgi:hypothetical protein
VLTANALCDWYRFTGAGTNYIEPGSQWQNPYVESFGERLRQRLLEAPGVGGGLADRVQQHLAAQRPGLPDPDRLRQDLDRQPSPR